MTPGWTSRSDDIEASSRRLVNGPGNAARSDLADVKRACVGLASVLTALGRRRRGRADGVGPLRGRRAPN